MLTLKESISRIKSLMKLHEVINIDNAGFSIDILSQHKSFSSRIKFCDSLTKLGVGSSRRAYKLGDTALKLAINDKGIHQNKAEASSDIHQYYDSIITNIVSVDPTFKWLVCELARKAKKDDFLKLTGIPYDIFIEFMSYRIMVLGQNGGKYQIDHGLNDEQLDYCNENSFMGDLLELIGSYGIAGGDLTRISSYGVVNRNGKDVLVLLDYGGTETILQNMYMREELD